MKYAMKEALVLTTPDGGDGHGQSSASSRLVFYIDTDAERIAFIDWYVKKVDTMKSLFEHLDTPPFVHSLLQTDQTRLDPIRPDQT